MLAVISGRRVAMRMASVAIIWVLLGSILALYYSDRLFIVFGVLGAFGAGISTVVALAADSSREVASNDGDGSGAGPLAGD